MKKSVQYFTINAVERLDAEHILIEAVSPVPLQGILPGQFVNIDVEKSKTTFLRRPISIHDVDEAKNSMKIFVKAVGDGTRAIYEMQKGEKLNTMFPLGNSFSYSNSQKPLLVGGGFGLAPLYYLAKKIAQNGIRPTVIVGARNSKNIFLTEKFQDIADVHVATNDGSLGEKGMVTEHSLFTNLENFDKIFVCGPEPMMKAVGKIAVSKNVECEVSLENTMACGIGSCLCCVADTKDGHVCVCTEGPVFNIKDLKW
ncbi:MAG: dihydroorotate dehydrogenase electron transfer subunit [Bacteroidales bacterium]|jgi:dihydroorotate dehydrogenase electron transfer subunit|nr:dihydroorotate dehydrogenase electron transfer subunit [Bacteroidales bacterium]